MCPTGVLSAGFTVISINIIISGGNNFDMKVLIAVIKNGLKFCRKMLINLISSYSIAHGFALNFVADGYVQYTQFYQARAFGIHF